ncbi:DNA gyrase subunit A, chloroplastic/mitochondrial [Sesamum angolense]|uniref:DNA topoisomerase (ATP-hydrolyzing) n=1 Tax=Sesamum angolense TaxID=2727404 RepID=A0AAE2C6J0_9LAMI|nr:DNA gyrase subunit A, chloroplastic/mitochondrial [Sesamum angolense]
MNPYCIAPRTHFGALNPGPGPATQAMAFSTGLRLLRCHPHSLSFCRPSPPRLLLAGRVSELRFLYAVAPHHRRRFFSVQASARGEEEDVVDNGSVVAVRDGGGNGGEGGEGRIVISELHKEATEAYMAYAMSVLLGRALPDVRDGLKPVHRRILYAMHELGLSSRKPYKKCARVVGEVLGKFHPHGDNAVYDSLVRMAQDFSLRSPLIRGHGNFGSIDADPPAAMRYTECRLEALTEAMLLADLEQDTVDFIPNFDNSQKEPSLLPARIPNLLLNGASGIAVGMATNIPPHNLGELVDALSVLIHNPDATLQELLEYMPGPDFPTGGIVMGNIGIMLHNKIITDSKNVTLWIASTSWWCLGAGELPAQAFLFPVHGQAHVFVTHNALWRLKCFYRQAYRTGRGRVVIRGKTDVELLDSKSKRSAIIIKEIPYQTNKASLVEKIAELVENKSLEGISDIRDESDRCGMRIVIELKRGSDPSIVLNNLYRLTALQSTFSCNMVGILNGQPKQMGLKELLQAFLDFRCSVVERRAKFKLSQAQDRYHIVEPCPLHFSVVCRRDCGLVRVSREFNLSDKQAEAILDISLRKITSLEKNKFIDEGKSLSEQISKLQELLSSKELILELIEDEAKEIKNKFFTPRRSMLEDTDSGQLEDIDVIPNEEMLLALSEKGYLKRMRPDTFNLQNRGTIGKSVGKLRVNDTMSDFLVCRTHDHVLYFRPMLRFSIATVACFLLHQDHKISCSIVYSCSEEKLYLRLVVSFILLVYSDKSDIGGADEYQLCDKGTVYSARAYRIPECSRAGAGTPLVQVPADELKWVRRCTNDDYVAMASHNGMVILSPCGNIRALGRNTRGGVAMRLKQGDKMASMDLIPASLGKMLEKGSESQHTHGRGSTGPWLLFISESGYGKRVPLASFRMSRLNRVGLKGYKFSLEDRLAAVFVVGFSVGEDGESDEQVVLVSQSGTVNRIKVRDISIQSRFARGVILMRLEHAGKIQSASLISETEKETEELQEAAA